MAGVVDTELDVADAGSDGGDEVLVGPLEPAIDDGADAGSQPVSDVVDGDVVVFGQVPTGPEGAGEFGDVGQVFVLSNAVRSAEPPDGSVQRGGGEGREGSGGSSLGGRLGVDLVGVDTDASGVPEDVAHAEVEELPASGTRPTTLGAFPRPCPRCTGRPGWRIGGLYLARD
ncbi:MAG: hypothetical protein M3P53_02510 [Actinomycetota bacterium]|nr:hypothetical protein [Actinomycetota bacterium]